MVAPRQMPSQEQDDIEEDYMRARTSHRESMDAYSPRLTLETPSTSFRNLKELAAPAESDEEIARKAMPYLGHDRTSMALDQDTPKIADFPTSATAGFPIQQPDSPTPDNSHRSPQSPNNSRRSPQSPAAVRIFSNCRASANVEASFQHVLHMGTGIRRRRSTGKPRNLGDTDSEGELEPGTVTIIR